MICNILSLRGVLSHFRHCGRIAIYNINQKIGVKAIIKKIDKIWNQKEELRALESLITRIKMDNRNKNII